MKPTKKRIAIGWPHILIDDYYLGSVAECGVLKIRLAPKSYNLDLEFPVLVLNPGIFNVVELFTHVVLENL